MSYINNIDIGKPLGLFGDVKTISRDSMIELKATYGLSALRDIVTEVGSASVTNDFTEFLLSTGTTTGSDAKIESAERGRYLPGAEAEAGIGVRIPSTFTGDEHAEWGYFDEDNGLGFGVDATGTYTFVRSGGSDTKTYQSNWNASTLDSGNLILDLSEGNIFQINYSWYGYGAIEFKVVLPDDNNIQRQIVVHRFSSTQSVSIENPNLPVTAQVSNGTGTNDLSVYVGGRQYATYSRFQPNTRVNSHRRLGLGSVGETFLPVVSFRRKSAFESVAAKIDGLDIITDAALIFQIRIDASLTGASYGTPTDTTASETAMEADSSATAVSGGELVYQGLVAVSGTGGNSSGEVDIQSLLVEIPSTQPVTLCVRQISGTGGTVSSVVRWTEEW